MRRAEAAIRSVSQYVLFVLLFVALLTAVFLIQVKAS
jgi:hypothetical protein